MSPTRYRLPQRCSSDLRRGRRATLNMLRERYALIPDALTGNPAPGFQLPPYLASLPRAEKFSGPKFSRIASHKLRFQINMALFKRVLRDDPELNRLGDYARLYPLVERPSNVSYAWPSDADFARERLQGVNPMALRRFDGDYTLRAADHDVDRRVGPDSLGRLLAAAEARLQAEGAQLSAVRQAGRLFLTDYTDLWDARIQRAARQKSRVLAAPVCLYWVDGSGELAPLALQLRPPGADGDPIYTPESPRAAWLMARCHAQAADAHYHEAVYHLLETHLVSEVFAACTHRHLHPDHPLHQLFAPHFEFNLAIDALARTDILGIGGPIDMALSAGVAGGLDLARICWSRWSFSPDYLTEDLAARGVHDGEALPRFYMREDALKIWKILGTYTEDLLGIWYRSDDDVRGDTELQAWAGALSDPAEGAIPGFPEQIDDRASLFKIARAVIFRCSAHHAAVNNGQYDTYGWIPNAPGLVSYPLPSGEDEVQQVTEARLLRAMARMTEAAAQIGMTWTLSEPTHRSLLALGDSDAFRAENSFAADQIVETCRHRLAQLSLHIQSRNADLAHPYTYLDPRVISRSTGT